YRRALTIAQETGNRQFISSMATMLCIVAANEDELFLGTTNDNAIDTFHYLSLAIRRYHDAGNVVMIQNPLVILAAVFDRIGRHEQAAVIIGFAATEMARAGYPQINATIAHLREVLGDQMYELLVQKGEAMSTGALVTYALDQIDQVRTELSIGSK